MLAIVPIASNFNRRPHASPKRQDFGAEVTCSHTIAADGPALSVSRLATIRPVLAPPFARAVFTGVWSVPPPVSVSRLAAIRQVARCVRPQDGSFLV